MVRCVLKILTVQLSQCSVSQKSYEIQTKTRISRGLRRPLPARALKTFASIGIPSTQFPFSDNLPITAVTHEDKDQGVIVNK